MKGKIIFNGSSKIIFRKNVIFHQTHLNPYFFSISPYMKSEKEKLLKYSPQIPSNTKKLVGLTKKKSHTRKI